MQNKEKTGKLTEADKCYFSQAKFFADAPKDTGWNGEVITGTTGNNHRHWPSLEYASTGDPRVVHVNCGDGLYYRARAGGQWYEEQVESAGVAAFCDLALKNDLPWISYSANGNLKCAWKDANNVWHDEIVVEGGSTSDTSICISPADGQPRISYQDATDGALKYAYRVDTTPANWVVETIDSRSGNIGSAGWNNSIAINPVTKEVGISYGYTDETHSDPGYIKFAWRDPVTAKFQTTIISSEWTRTTSLAFDAAGNPCIAYHERTFYALAVNDNLAYTKHLGALPGGTWYYKTFLTDASDGYDQSIVLSNSGSPRISSIDQTNNRVMFTWQDPIGQWQTESVLPARVSDQTSIAKYQTGSADKTGICYILYSEAASTWSVSLIEKTYPFN